MPFIPDEFLAPLTVSKGSADIEYDGERGEDTQTQGPLAASQPTNRDHKDLSIEEWKEDLLLFSVNQELKVSDDHTARWAVLRRDSDQNLSMSLVCENEAGTETKKVELLIQGAKRITDWDEVSNDYLLKARKLYESVLTTDVPSATRMGRKVRITIGSSSKILHPTDHQFKDIDAAQMKEWGLDELSEGFEVVDEGMRIRAGSVNSDVEGGSVELHRDLVFVRDTGKQRPLVTLHPWVSTD